jgi:tetratricopeptide (TPR) repeat protein
MRFDAPVDASLDPNTPFKPKKLVIDSADRVYCVAEGSNKGLVKYEADGVFTGFIGANKVTFDWYEYLWKKFSTQAQRDKMESFVPTEYDNAYIDKEGFIYVCTDGYTEDEWREESAEAVRKLNIMGNDILVRNGTYPIYGDLYVGTAGQYSGPSAFQDVTVLDNDVYVCLDSNRGRLFGYDDQGKLVFAFGGGGNMEGYFRKAYSPTAIEHMGNALYVLDNLDCSITMFVTTEFGETVYDAMEQFDDGKYEASEASWRHAMVLNGNYDLAYIGIGRALLRQERYGEAMEYFELKYDAENYSKAYKQYRKEWVEDNIAIIVVILMIIILIPLGIGRIKSIKHEIEIADIFKV